MIGSNRTLARHAEPVAGLGAESHGQAVGLIREIESDRILRRGVAVVPLGQVAQGEAVVDRTPLVELALDVAGVEVIDNLVAVVA